MSPRVGAAVYGAPQARQVCAGMVLAGVRRSSYAGRPAEQIIGRNMHALIHHSHADGRHCPECDCPIFNAFRRGLPCRIDDEVLWRADGSAFSAEYSSHPILEKEMLSNVARHAQARSVQIRIAVDGPPQPVLCIDVRDDGIGAAPQALNDARSYGVMGMRERAAHVGGKLSIDGTPGLGTRVRLVMPLPEAQAAS